MSQIGSFTRSTDGSYTGTIKTLAIDVKARLVPSDPASTSDKAPDLRVVVSGVEIGAAWRRTSKEDRHLPLGQARRSVVHRAASTPTSSRARTANMPDLVALTGTRGAPLHSGASHRPRRYYAEYHSPKSPHSHLMRNQAIGLHSFLFVPGPITARNFKRCPRPILRTTQIKR